MITLKITQKVMHKGIRRVQFNFGIKRVLKTHAWVEVKPIVFTWRSLASSNAPFIMFSFAASLVVKDWIEEANNIVGIEEDDVATWSIGHSSIHMSWSIYFLQNNWKQTSYFLRTQWKSIMKQSNWSFCNMRYNGIVTTWILWKPWNCLCIKKPKGRGMEMKFMMKPSIVNQTHLYVPTHNNTLLETSCLLFRHVFLGL